MAGKNGKTRPFTSVNYSQYSSRYARQRQQREYEQQKKEKLIFALFVVIILVMILFAVLIFNKVMGNVPEDTETESGTETSAPIEGKEDQAAHAVTGYRSEVRAKSDIYQGNLILIDSSHPLRASAPTLEDIYDSRTKFEKANSTNGYIYSFYPADHDVLLESETLTALNSMANDFYRATGNYDLFIHANAAYRENASDDHATGRAFDLSVWTGGDDYYSIDDPKVSGNFEWLRENYYKYGFIRCGSACDGNKPYHFLYVGLPHAQYMHDNDLSLEEYWSRLRTHHAFGADGENSLTVNAADGNRYQIYYVAANGDMVNIPVPESCQAFTVSGDNASGFAVTVKCQ